ncbi:DUF4387 family protein [uncultured Jannaschia sp.]|uniref:DUF4387 family protein n=1 Tax=uncultured Jannaschia sp. TaxID=293347 RepID=UPI00262704CD|nr:DUF4387 family protein [uncultured Jannaschia sp.]
MSEELGRLARIRSKNAGPFWLTIDIFCSETSYGRVSAIPTETFAARLAAPDLRRFDLPDLHVVKLSLPRPEIQGSLRDRDMHGAAMAQVLAAMAVG